MWDSGEELHLPIWQEPVAVTVDEQCLELTYVSGGGYSRRECFLKGKPLQIGNPTGLKGTSSIPMPRKGVTWEAGACSFCYSGPDLECTPKAELHYSSIVLPRLHRPANHGGYRES